MELSALIFLPKFLCIFEFTIIRSEWENVLIMTPLLFLGAVLLGICRSGVVREKITLRLKSLSAGLFITAFLVMLDVEMRSPTYFFLAGNYLPQRILAMLIRGEEYQVGIIICVLITSITTYVFLILQQRYSSKSPNYLN